MIIVGAKGFAKEVLEIAHQLEMLNDLVFFDDVSKDIDDLIYEKFKVLRSTNEVKAYFKTHDNSFVLGVGNPKVRKQLAEKFINIGGELRSIISPKADIGHYDNFINEGSIITSGCILTNSITLGKGCLINLNTTIGHDCTLQNYVEICPGVNISGNVTIGQNTFVGTNATILPGITIGDNCIVAAGSVVTKNIPNDTLVAGVPAVIKKQL